MARFTANVDVTTDTFDNWVVKTNDLLNSLSTEIITANSAVANTGTPGSQREARLYGSFAANTLVAETALRGGTSAASANLDISSNVVVTGTSYLTSDAEVTGYINVSSTASITGNATFGGFINVSSTANVGGVATFSDTTNSTSTSTGILRTVPTVISSGSFSRLRTPNKSSL